MLHRCIRHLCLGSGSPVLKVNSGALLLLPQYWMYGHIAANRYSHLFGYLNCLAMAKLVCFWLLGHGKIGLFLVAWPWQNWFVFGYGEDKMISPPLDAGNWCMSFTDVVLQVALPPQSNKQINFSINKISVRWKTSTSLPFQYLFWSS